MLKAVYLLYWWQFLQQGIIAEGLTSKIIFVAMLQRIRFCTTEEDYRQLLPQFIQR